MVATTISHQWQLYPESIAEVAQQLQNDIHGKHQKLERAIKAILAKCLPPPGQASILPMGPCPATVTAKASYVHERLMQLGHATADLGSFCVTQTMQTAILAEGLQAVSDAALNYSDMICTMVASSSVNLARMAQQNASIEALHLESTRADLDRHDTLLQELLRRHTQLQQDVHILRLSGLRDSLRAQSRAHSSASRRQGTLWSDSEEDSAGPQADTASLIAAAQRVAARRRRSTEQRPSL